MQSRLPIGVLTAGLGAAAVIAFGAGPALADQSVQQPSRLTQAAAVDQVRLDQTITVAQAREVCLLKAPLSDLLKPVLDLLGPVLDRLEPVLKGLGVEVDSVTCNSTQGPNLEKPAMPAGPGKPAGGPDVGGMPGAGDMSSVLNKTVDEVLNDPQLTDTVNKVPALAGLKDKPEFKNVLLKDALKQLGNKALEAMKPSTTPAGPAAAPGAPGQAR